jgi:hypothetical protein
VEGRLEPVPDQKHSGGGTFIKRLFKGHRVNVLALKRAVLFEFSCPLFLLAPIGNQNPPSPPALLAGSDGPKPIHT